MSQYSMEMKIEIFDDAEGVSIQVRQWPDMPDDLIEIHTSHNKKSEDYYGKQSITLCHDQVRMLIEALNKIMHHQKGDR